MSGTPYETPKEYAIKLHFDRSRLQTALEENLYRLCLDLASLGTQTKESFEKNLSERIKSTFLAEDLGPKTIANIRTEMTTLFGLVKEINGNYSPTKRTVELARTNDTKRFFKLFCSLFQWPGGFNKKNVTKELAKAHVRFKPCQYVLSVLSCEAPDSPNGYLTVPEACHMIFNDKRITVNRDAPDACWKRILENRKNRADYSTESDTIRYTRDFLNFMHKAELIAEKDREFRLNHNEEESIKAIISDNRFFEGFNHAVVNDSIEENRFDKAQKEWTDYFGDELGLEEFESRIEDIVDTSAPTQTIEYEDVTGKAVGKPFKPKVKGKTIPVEFLKAKSAKADKIGAVGQDIVVSRERDFLRENGRSNLADMVKDVSENAGLGYDIESFDLSNNRKYIEVKATESQDPEYRFEMTSTEWNTARELGDAYSIYRVQIVDRTHFKIREFRDPYKLHSQGKITLEPKSWWVQFSLQ